jgi:hypothetical protein
MPCHGRFGTVTFGIGHEQIARFKGQADMPNGTMGRALHPKTVERVRELLRKGNLTSEQISIRTGISTSQVRNILHGYNSSKYKPKPTIRDPEYENIFDGEKRWLETEPAPTKPKPKPSPTKNESKDLFSNEPASKCRPALTHAQERSIVADFRGNLTLPMIAKKHGVSLDEVELLNERVYWWQAIDDLAVRPCMLSKAEYLRTIGPKLTAAQMEEMKPAIDGFETMVMDLLNVDQPTAATIRKVTTLHHLEAWPNKPKPAPKADNDTPKIVEQAAPNAKYMIDTEGNWYMLNKKGNWYRV